MNENIKTEKTENTDTSEELVIGKEEIAKAAEILSQYKSAKARLEARITDNERWFRMRHWEQLREKDSQNIKPTAWLFNSILNKHADFMDSIPGCTVLPREKSDTASAEQLTSILPVIFDRCCWESVYSDAAFYKLKTGTAVYSVLWNPEASGGIGDIDIKQIDLLNLFWEPGVRDIQKSRNLFHMELVDNDILLDTYPFLEGKLSAPSQDVSLYSYDSSVDTSDKSSVVDWYYKKNVNGKTLLHYCKFVNDCVLYASENDEELRDTGWYDHGLYPFVFDPLFKEEGTPIGFGFIDVMKPAQEEIDILNTQILKNARMASKRRYFTRTDGAVNEKEFADFDKDFVHVSGSSLGEDSLREISVNPLSSIYVTILNNKINELKETSANRDFSQGSTSGGVTSGAAISLLQESGNKISRDMINATYRAFSQVCTLCIELIRQFYSIPRSMRILGDNGEWTFCDYDNSAIRPVSLGTEFGIELGERLPVFDVVIKAHKQNEYSRAAQNNDALNFYSMGFFNPEKSIESLACLQLIDIENKEKLMHIIEENGKRYNPALSQSASEPSFVNPTSEEALRLKIEAARKSGV